MKQYKPNLPSLHVSLFKIIQLFKEQQKGENTQQKVIVIGLLRKNLSKMHFKCIKV